MKIQFVNYAAMTKVSERVAAETLKVQQSFEKERSRRNSDGYENLNSTSKRTSQAKRADAKTIA